MGGRKLLVVSFASWRLYVFALGLFHGLLPRQTLITQPLGIGYLRGRSRRVALKRAFVLALACLLLLSVPAASQTKRRSPKKPGASFAEKQQAEIRAGREQIALQVKALTQFLYLFGGITKGIEIAERAKSNREESVAGMSSEQIQQTKAKVKDSIASVRTGLDKLESSFRLNPVLQSYYPSLSGVARIAQTAETQAAAGNFDQAGRSLIAAVSKLTDALLAIR